MFSVMINLVVTWQFDTLLDLKYNFCNHHFSLRPKVDVNNLWIAAEDTNT